MSLVENGKVVANTTTDENGLYSFEKRPAWDLHHKRSRPDGHGPHHLFHGHSDHQNGMVTNVNFGIRGSNSISNEVRGSEWRQHQDPVRRAFPAGRWS